MRVIVIGDIHGRNEWHEVLNREKEEDKIVFIGDYFDTHEDISPEAQIANFEQIMLAKKEDDRIITLIGNHDLHYLIAERYSGYQDSHALLIMQQLRDHLDQLSAAYSADGVLYTHAGVTRTWCKGKNLTMNENIASSICKLFKEDPDALGFDGTGGYFRTDPSGDNTWQGPIWVRPRSLKFDKLDGWQVVGHTRQYNVVTKETSMEIDETNKVCLIDTFPFSYLSVIDGKEFKEVHL